MPDGKEIDDAIASAVFFPRPDAPFGPPAAGAFDQLFERADGVRLRLRVHPAGPDDACILFFHGNGETALDYDFAAAEYNRLPAWLVVAEYRGYGPCTGRPSVHSFLPDAHAALDELCALLARRGHRGPRLVMGRSLGSAPAIELASARATELDALIVESGFARIVPLLELCGVPAGDLGLTEDWGPRNLAKMKTVRLPSLVMHAEQDQIIPFAEGQMLFDACQAELKLFFPVAGAGHNDIHLRAGAAYFEQIAALLGRLRA
ncbi:MAG: alpha/beta hydrolase [Deltaproteobacteria bacterium]|nr:alpha/beta hydrolase [Deltaproteobacteria bacterium]